MAPPRPLALAVACTGALQSARPAAAQIHLQGVEQVASSSLAAEPVTGISPFADVRPSDWAYQALTGLIERHACVAGYPDGSFGGQRAMTRFEAAALLNACLDRVSEVSDELRRLMVEFEKELAVLKGRVDGLEARVGELEASRFSATTRLKGEVSFILAGSPDFDTPRLEPDGSRPPRPDRTTFNDDLRLFLDTSFSGRDLLRIRLRSGNLSRLPFREGIFTLARVTGGGEAIRVERFVYAVPVGESVTLTLGPLARNNEMLSFLPTAYRSGVLDFFNLAGASGVYNKATGPGVGISWRQPVETGRPRLTFDASYVAANGFADAAIGAFDSESGINATTQLGYRGTNWGLALAYRYGSANTRLLAANVSGRVPPAGESSSLALAGFWSPVERVWLPSISLGYGANIGSGGVPDSQSWMAGLQWSDLFGRGHAAGFALGQPPFSAGENRSMLYELFYRLPVSDAITVSPALFYGQKLSSNSGNEAWGGMVQAIFRF